jgi:hypothetical protein
MCARAVATVLVVFLAAAPATVLLCDMDCTSPTTQVSTGHEHARDQQTHSGASATETLEPSPHDCHATATAAGLAAIAAGSRECTHARLATAPAKPSPGSGSGPALSMLSLIAGATDIVAPLNVPAQAATPQALSRQWLTPALVVPLRI